jgi:putative cell wall-binding protein
VATGRNFPDALAAGPAAARNAAPVLLVDGEDPGGSPASSAWLAETSPTNLVLVGGTAAISQPVADALQELLP